MAGMRLGYCIGHADLISAFDKVRNHFGITRMGQAAGVAALADQDHLRSVVAKVKAAREEISGLARTNGLTPLPSATNFVTIDCGRDGSFAKRVLDNLVAAGVFVRMPGVAPLNRCIRITAGTPEDVAVLAEEGFDAWGAGFLAGFDQQGDVEAEASAFGDDGAQGIQRLLPLLLPLRPRAWQRWRQRSVRWRRPS
jgi:aspartate/methionine/tyrosine aminotransferase